MLNLDLSSVLAAVGAVSEAKQPGMIDFDYSFLFQMVNFLIVWIVLNLILIKPIRGIIAKRQEPRPPPSSRITSRPWTPPVRSAPRRATG